MKRECIITGIVCLILAGLAGADYLSTTISTDGSVMLATAGSDANGSFASRVLSLDTARMSRMVSAGDTLEAVTSVSGAGPMVFSDYSSGKLILPDIREMCTFLDNEHDRTLGESSLYSSGILHGGEYDISRVIGSGLEGESMVNGSGMLVFGSESSDNRSLQSRAFVTGNMSVKDFTRFGGRW
jgi:hypothetical protein